MQRIKVGDLEIAVAKEPPRADDGFLCSKCLSEGKVRDLHVVPERSEGQRWTGAFRCAGCRAATYAAARASLGGAPEEELFDFFDTVQRYGPPLVALGPVTRNKSLAHAALDVLELLETGAFRGEGNARPHRR